MNTFFRLIALGLVLFLASCGGGGDSAGTSPLGGNVPNLFTSAPSTLNVEVGRSADFTIGGGKPPYSVSSSDSATATAGLQGSSAFTVAGARGGSAVITVKDSQGNAVAINVTVGSSAPLFTTANTEASGITVAVGDSAAKNFAIGGGVAPYTVTSSNDAVVTVERPSLDLFRVTGIADGNATLTLRDSAGAVISLRVTVQSRASTQLLVSPATASGTVGDSLSFVILGGDPSYSIQVNNEAVASYEPMPTGFKVTLRRAGVTDVTVRDSKGQLQVIKVTAVSAPTRALAVSAPRSLTMSVGEARGPFVISGGAAPYRVVSSNESVVSVPGTQPTDSAFSLNAKGAGKATVNISDALGAPYDMEVTIGPAVSLFTTAPSRLTLAPNAVSETYFIFGGVAPYYVSVTNPAVASYSQPEKSGNRVQFVGGTGPGPATTSAVVRDSAGAQVPITLDIGSVTPLFTSASSRLTLSKDEKRSFSVGGGSPGSGGYLATSSNEGVVKPKISGSLLEIEAKGAGQATVVVTDAVGSSIPLNISVGSTTTLFTTAPGTITVGIGDDPPRTFDVGGGAMPYKAESSNKAVADAALGLGGSSVIVTGKAAGSSTIVITDSLGSTSSFQVNVSSGAAAPLAVSPLAATGVVGGVLTFQVRGGLPGAGGYSAYVNNPAVATATGGAQSFTVNLLAAGQTTVVVRDSLGELKEVGITVTTPPSTSLYTSAPASVNLNLGQPPDRYLVGGGKADYKFHSSDTSVVLVSAPPDLVLTPVGAGTATVVVTDSLGATSKISVTVGGRLPLVTTAPSAISLVPSPTAYSYKIIGGRAPYRATSSNESVATTPGVVPDDDLRITAVGAGTARVVVTDAAGSQTFVDVTVSAQGGSSPLTVSPPTPAGTGAAGNVGDQLGFTIFGGRPDASGKYTVAINNLSVAQFKDSPSSFNLATSPAFVVNLVSSGATTMTVTDSAGQTVTVNLVVATKTTELRMQPAAVVVDEKYDLGVFDSSIATTKNIVLNISGGTAPYRAFTSDGDRTQVTVSGNAVHIAKGAQPLCLKGNYSIRLGIDVQSVQSLPITELGALKAMDIVVTVIDSKGASTVAKMVVIDRNDADSCP